MSDLKGSVIARYRVDALAGEGAMSSVWVATPLDRPRSKVALKFLRAPLSEDSLFCQRFRDEAEALARLAHPNVVRMQTSFAWGRDLCIVLDYIEGDSLADLLARSGPLPVPRAIELIKGVLDGLDHAHQNGVIHRDVKPSNILLDAAGVPLLCDFGIAKQVQVQDRTVVGGTLGTPEYMSPEQIFPNPQHPIDHRTDVYAAGVVLYEMLTGRLPFPVSSKTGDYLARRASTVSEPTDPRVYNRAIDPALAQIVLKALRKDRQRRYQGCAIMREALECHERGEPEPTTVIRETPSREPARGAVWFQHPDYQPCLVPGGFSWQALFGNVFWMLSKGMVGRAFAWLAMYGALAVVALGVDSDPVLMLAAAAFAALLLIPGLWGNAWRRRVLLRRGFVVLDPLLGVTVQ